MIHRDSGTPIKYQKGVESERGFKEVPEAEIIKGYEHAKGHHVLIKPSEIDELKLEAKHTIDMVRFVDREDISPVHWDKLDYLLPRMVTTRKKATSYCAMRLSRQQQGRDRTVHHAWARTPSRHYGARQGPHAGDPALCR